MRAAGAAWQAHLLLAAALVFVGCATPGLKEGVAVGTVLGAGTGALIGGGGGAVVGGVSGAVVGGVVAPYISDPDAPIYLRLVSAVYTKSLALWGDDIWSAGQGVSVIALDRDVAEVEVVRMVRRATGAVRLCATSGGLALTASGIACAFR